MPSSAKKRINTPLSGPGFAIDLHLRKGGDRRLRQGHLWVYSNEVDSKRSSLAHFSPGDRVNVLDSNGKVLGSAYMEPNSLICARVYAPRQTRPMDVQFFSERIDSALAVREAAFDQPYYRLVFGDSDWLPGLVVDRFGDYLVVQCNNAGIERYESLILEALVECLSPAGVLLRADSRARKELDLPQRIETIYGTVPNKVELVENGVRFLAPVWDGQKTGWFYDHRMSRARLASCVAGKSVLDVYSYIGGWGIQAACFGASKVCCVDSSATALAGVQENAALNSVDNRVSTRQGMAVPTLSAMSQENLQFDVVIIDPPAFIQKRRDLKKGIAAYRKVNELGLRLLSPGGLLVSASCSMHLSRSDLMDAVAGAATRSSCDLRIIEQGAQGADHPIHPSIPETEYLKAVFSRRL